MLSSGIEQTLTPGVLSDRVHVVVCLNSINDAGPGGAVVVSAEDVRRAILLQIVFYRDIGRAGLMRRSLDQTNARELGHSRRRDFRPALSLIASDINQAVIRAGPYRAAFEPRRRYGEYRAKY